MIKFNSLSLNKKLLLSFALVVLFFGAVIAILISSQMKLGLLQDTGATRFRNALKVSEINTELAEIYSVSADAVINRNLDQTKKDLAEIHKRRIENLKTISEIVTSTEDKKILSGLENIIQSM